MKLLANFRPESVRAVVFNLLGTLVKYHPWEFAHLRDSWLGDYFDQPLPRAEILFEKHRPVGEVAQDQIAWMQALANDFGHPLNAASARNVLEQLGQQLAAQVTLYEEVSVLLGWLHRRDLKLGICANLTPPSTRIGSALELESMVDFVGYSCQLGLSKPDPALFVTVLKALEVEPEQVLYVDDDHVSCRAAQELGLWSILVRHHEGQSMVLSDYELAIYAQRYHLMILDHIRYLGDFFLTREQVKASFISSQDRFRLMLWIWRHPEDTFPARQAQRQSLCGVDVQQCLRRLQSLGMVEPVDKDTWQRLNSPHWSAFNIHLRGLIATPPQPL